MTTDTVDLRIRKDLSGILDTYSLAVDTGHQTQYLSHWEPPYRPVRSLYECVCGLWSVGEDEEQEQAGAPAAGHH